MAENYDLIFGQSASQQYGWSDSDYQNGWQTVGSTPPTAEQFDALQRRSDTKAKDLNDRLSPLETKAEVDGRQAATSYTSGAMLTVDGLPNGWLLECIAPGISGTDAITLPDTLIDGLTIIDGNVTWALRKVATNGGLGYRQPSTAYAVGNIAYHASLPTGYHLECTTGGTTSSGDLTIGSPSIGGTVSDGTVQWQIRKGVTLPYELPEYMETLLDDKDAETARATLGAPSMTGANASGSWNINAATATKLATPRTIALTGNVTGSADFDGSKDIQIATSLADVSALAHSLLSKTTAADMREAMDIKISGVGAGTEPITAVIGDFAMFFGQAVIPGGETELTVQLPFDIWLWGRKVLLTQYGFGNYATLMYIDKSSSNTNMVVRSSTSSPEGIYFFWLVAGRKG